MTVLVVGAGLTGSVIARELAVAGFSVEVFDRRDHIAGNLFDYRSEDGILVQKYGPHSFFTDNPDIEIYVNQYVETEYFAPEYETRIDGVCYPMPFNFRAIDLLYDRKIAETLKVELVSEFKTDIVSVLDLVNSKNALIKQYGVYIYENEYRRYTAKQWGMPIENILPEVFTRVPVYLSYKKEYQRQEFQFIPKGGFSNFVELLLTHPNIQVKLNAEFASSDLGTVPIVYTGALDMLFDFCYGELPYRSLAFLTKTIPRTSFQAKSITAYPQEEKITRITEYTKFPPQKLVGKTIISIEIPGQYDRNNPLFDEPYYPISNRETAMLYAKYLGKANEISNLFIAGRLGDYKYYNMDMAIVRALEVAESVKRSYL